MRTWLLTAVLSAAALGSSSAALSENALFVLTAPDKTSFWRTATNNVVVLPIYYPKGASSATLEVRGERYFRSYSALTEGSFELVLPKPEKAQDENVYELKLIFDEGTVRMARLGLLAGSVGKADGVTRCVFDRESSDWSTFYRRAVLPVPQGVASLKINDVEVDPALSAGRGWYALAAERGTAHLDLALITPDGEIPAELIGHLPGLLLLFR